MPEAFKNVFNVKLIRGMSKHFKAQWPMFDAKAFVKTAAENLDELELKQRSEQIMNAMIRYLPDDFKKAGEIILASLSPALEGDIFDITVDDKGIAGWAIMPITHYVAVQGHEHFKLSMCLFKELTKRFSSEFGIRFFLISSPKKTLSTLKKWCKDKNRHVRRLASEGSRTRLPWAMCLPQFIEDPAPLIELLEILKDDKEEYVRRSVANNLNDISKDHPDLVADIASKWMKAASPQRKKLIRHACRTLLKKGHKKTLQVFGYKSPKLAQSVIKLKQGKLVFGAALEFSLRLSSEFKSDQPLMIDYIIHHQKANGTTSPKVFKWRTKVLPANGLLEISKKHTIKKITTRVYYPGKHVLEVMVNGVSVGSKKFKLLMPE